MRLAACLTLLLAVAAPAHAQLVAAVLPSSRSVQVGTPATAFATIINAGTSAATGCGIAPASPVPASFVYQTTDPATNALTGTANTPADIPPGGAQTFVIALTPIVPFDGSVAFAFDCQNTDPAPVVTGVNTLELVAENDPVPDIVAVARTIANDGIVVSPGAFAVAVTNVGVAPPCVGIFAGGLPCGCVEVGIEVHASGAGGPFTVCQTVPGTGQCVIPPAERVSVQLGPGATASFGVFVNSAAAVPFNPATNRVHVHFTAYNDFNFPPVPSRCGFPTEPIIRAYRGERGSTSVAVRTLP